MIFQQRLNLNFKTFARTISFLGCFVGASLTGSISYAVVGPGYPSLEDRIISAKDHLRAVDSVFAEAAASQNPKLRILAAKSLGHIGDPVGAPALLKLMNDKFANVRQAAAFAAGYVNSAEIVAAVRARMDLETDTKTMGSLLLSFARLNGSLDPQNASAALVVATQKLNDALARPEDRQLQADAGEAVGLLLSHASGQWEIPQNLFEQMATMLNAEDFVSVTAAYGFARFRGDYTKVPADKIIDSFKKSSNSNTRGYLARALGKIASPEARLVLLDYLNSKGSLVANTGVSVEVLRALSNFAYDEAIGSTLKHAVIGGSTGLQERAQALETLATFGVAAAALGEDIAGYANRVTVPWLEVEALTTLAAIAPDKGEALAATAIKERNPLIIPAALAILSKLGRPEDKQVILDFALEADTRLAAPALDIVATHFVAEDVPESVQAALLSRAALGDVAIVAGISSVAVELKWQNAVPALLTAYSALGIDAVEGKIAIFDALGKIGTSAQADVMHLIDVGLVDPDVVVIRAAANAYESLTSLTASNRVPVVSRVADNVLSPSWNELVWAGERHAIVETTKGTFEIAMLNDAPLAAFNFIKLAKKRFYDDKIFHRVVPHFVVQGGDPRGDGYGGPGYLMRDEFSEVRHLRGTVGMASVGKDTAGCQFFVNTGANLHLDGNYTVFGRVTSGMEVVDKLGVGDSVIRISVR